LTNKIKYVKMVYIGLGLYALFLFGGDVMANEQNLIPFNERTESEKRAIATAGGKASGKARRNKKLLRDCIDYLLEREDKTVLDTEGNPMSGAEQLAYNLFVKALGEPDTAKAARAFEVLRDTAGQKPVEKVETKQTVIDMSSFTTEQLKEMLDNDITECD
jgi:hypothetical protein